MLLRAPGIGADSPATALRAPVNFGTTRAMNPLETYLKDLRDNRGAGVPETSGYPALSNLFNEIGKTLKPKVRCVINPANVGAGIPDGGLFTADQFQRAADAEPKQGQVPERGVVEVKGPADDVPAIARSEQVKKYSAKYGLVLVTNYRDFMLVGKDTQGHPLPMEGFTLAESEKEFWQLAEHPQKAAKEHGERFCEYLKRVMLSVAPLSAPQDVAWFLGSYARDAKGRVENHKDLSALAAVRDALEEALGMKFTGEKGEHFFRSTLVQTIFYGVFSAWVLWHRERPARRDSFDWRVSAWSLRVPFIRALYDEVATPNKLGPLGLVEVLDWTAGALNRVDRTVFFQKFRDEHAVQYFYEPFMEAYDPDLRKELGVWYTPLEIVRYQVARVDTVLREELGLPDGLADPNVVVLDPCCGTGAYIVEVLRKIAETLRAKGGDALIASDLKKAAMTRVFGFEIMPAPFVVSHLQLGLMLHDLGAPLSAKGDQQERVGVYLTNSLTGWEPPTEEGKKRIRQLGFGFPELQAERDAAEKVKRDSRILVVLGNPPYNAFAGVSPEEEQGLVEPYKKGLNTPPAEGGWGIKKFNLDDLYVRFFRLAERRIAEMTGRGVVSFISNFSYLSDPSFVVLRQRFLVEFDKLWFDCMNGDSRETGKLTPDGKPDPSVFSTDYNREGIRVGTAICVMVRKAEREKTPVVRYRGFWGVRKRKDLLGSLVAKRLAGRKAKPSQQNRYSFRPENVSDAYSAWPAVIELAAIPPFNGPVERRAGALVSIERDPLESRMKSYFDAKVSNDEIRAIYASLMMTGNRIVGPEARRKILAEHRFNADAIVRYPFKVFDTRWSYLENVRPLFSEPSPQLLLQRFEGNAFFITRDTADKTPEGPPFFFSGLVCDYDCISGHARHFPIRVMNGSRLEKKQEATLFDALGGNLKTDVPVGNLSKAVRNYLSKIRIKDHDAEAVGLVWLHALAVGYSPAYLAENADGIRRDWPRIPLPAARKALDKSAELGRKVAALLDTEAQVSGVLAGTVEPIFPTIGVLSAVRGMAVPARGMAVSAMSTTGIPPVGKQEEHGRDAHATHGQAQRAPVGDAHATAHATGQLDPDAGDLAVTAGWGHAGKGGVTMPGKGRIVARPYVKAELDAIADAAKLRGLSREQAIALLGPDTRDVYLNDKAYWSNVPANVWEYFIGGYQVIKKWLSYREQELLGRALSVDEAREVTGMARRLSAIVLMQPALDENYRRAAASAYAWPGATEE